MKSYQLGPIITVEAAEAITAKRLVTYDGKHTATTENLGVALFDTDSGDQISVQSAGIAVVEAGGSVSAGDHIQSDADGKAVTNAVDSDAKIAYDSGIALDAASESGDYIRIKIL